MRFIFARDRIYIELSVNDMKTKICIEILSVISSTDKELFRIKNIPYVNRKILPISINY